MKQQQKQEALRQEAEATKRRDNLQYSIILICILVIFAAVLSLGFVKISVSLAEGLIFFSFLILFEFLLVLTDPYVDQWTGGAPGWKLLVNAIFAGLIFPVHGFFEKVIKKRFFEMQKRKSESNA